MADLEQRDVQEFREGRFKKKQCILQCGISLGLGSLWAISGLGPQEDLIIPVQLHQSSGEQVAKQGLLWRSWLSNCHLKEFSQILILTEMTKPTLMVDT
ncbi:hypothetical protein MKW98_015497 [Papaver atlanticum]|uniref:Uncharacterized protein n=1 Tax=Papaver atlanticum TaxID=357466 RepID=A0AAD4S017_9MAGN|nr:hypothetical protein MKW98_015497 [Papaver atlanticum]